MPGNEAIIDLLLHLAEIKGQSDKLTPRRLDLYAEVLAQFPLPAVAAAIRALVFDPEPYFPQVGRIVAAIPAPTLDPEGAWRLARATLASYQPQTRPHPRSGNPAVDATIRALGGPDGCAWEDAIGQGIVRRRFHDEYQRQAGTPEHIAWALQHGPREPQLVAGLELPDWQASALRDKATQQGRPLPAPLAATLDGHPDRAVVPGQPAPPAPRPALSSGLPLTAARRAVLKDEVAAQIAKLAARMKLPAVDEEPQA